MSFWIDLMGTALARVWVTFTHNWPILLVSAAIATAMKLYIDQKKVAAFLNRHKGKGIFGATLVAVTTPLCSCGTTAVILGMMAGMFSWAPIIAFMVASPLTSPQQMLYSAGLFGWPFAIAFMVASVVLGLVGGLVGSLVETRGWLANQARYRPIAGGSGEAITATDALPMAPAVVKRPGLAQLTREYLLVVGRLLAFFFAFAFIGYVLNGLIPADAVARLFGSGRFYGVPLAATLGLPLYINTEASLPLVKSFMDMGMSPGASLAFLITGAGTSIGAITGALTIARWRVIGVVVGTLWVGAIVLGYLYNGLVAVGLV